VYLYSGYDEAPERHIGYVMHQWLCYLSNNMVNWTEHPMPLKVKVFTWAKDNAWASHVVYKNNKYYWFATMEHATIPGKAIGVAVSDNPTGPFRDDLGKALITNDITTDIKIGWDDIDLAVCIDDDGQTTSSGEIVN
jgi:beta-xylosidase